MIIWANLSMGLTVIMMLLVMQLLEKNMKSKSKKTVFECGFNPITTKKTNFSTNFLMVTMMFLIFDIEVSILIPPINSNKMLMSSLMASCATIISMLTILVMKEWKQGSLEWSQ